MPLALLVDGGPLLMAISVVALFRSPTELNRRHLASDIVSVPRQWPHLLPTLESPPTRRWGFGWGRSG